MTRRRHNGVTRSDRTQRSHAPIARPRHLDPQARPRTHIVPLCHSRAPLQPTPLARVLVAGVEPDARRAAERSRRRGVRRRHRGGAAPRQRRELRLCLNGAAAAVRRRRGLLHTAISKRPHDAHPHHRACGVPGLHASPPCGDRLLRKAVEPRARPRAAAQDERAARDDARRKAPVPPLPQPHVDHGPGSGRAVPTNERPPLPPPPPPNGQPQSRCRWSPMPVVNPKLPAQSQPNPTPNRDPPSFISGPPSLIRWPSSSGSSTSCSRRPRSSSMSTTWTI